MNNGIALPMHILMNQMIRKYCLSDDLATFDPYDIWKTGLGIRIKILFNYNRILGALPALCLTLYDLLINNRLRLGYKKQEYPVVRSFAAIALLTQHKIISDDINLSKAKNHIEWLVKNYSEGYSGYCWGINFALPVSKGLVYDRNAPFTTNTPYILEALLEYKEETRDDKYDHVIKSAFNFFEDDIQIMYEDDTSLATSYGPFNDRIVTNSVSYTMFAYSIFLKALPEKQEYITHKIIKLYNFIRKQQRTDGSWLYSPFDNKSFIDCFHSAFILKNLIKTHFSVELNDIDKVIDNGFDYIIQSFYHKNQGLFKRFSITNKPTLVKFDLYDNAEMLNLFILMHKLDLAENLNNAIIKNFIFKDDIYSMIDILGFRRNKNTLRWAVMPYLCALSKLTLCKN